MLKNRVLSIKIYLRITSFSNIGVEVEDLVLFDYGTSLSVNGKWGSGTNTIAWAKPV